MNIHAKIREGLFLFFVIMSCSCIQETKITVEPDPTQIIVNGLFNPDSIWTIQVSTTQAALDERRFLPGVEDAQIRLYEDGQLLGTMLHQSNGVYTMPDTPKVGVGYCISVEVAGYETLEACDQIPVTSSVYSSAFNFTEPVLILDGLGGAYPYFPLSYRFRDTIENQFYKLSLRMRDSCFQCDILGNGSLIIDDQWDDYLHRFEGQFFDEEDSEGAPNGIFLTSDVPFSQNQKEIRFGIDSTYLFYSFFIYDDDSLRSPRYAGTFPPQTPKKFVRLYVDKWTMSEALYNYYQSYFKQSYGIADPLATYTPVFSNVRNGLGIFAGYQRQLNLVYTNE